MSFHDVYFLFTETVEKDCDSECQKMAVQALMLLQNSIKQVKGQFTLTYISPKGPRVIISTSRYLK